MRGKNFIIGIYVLVLCFSLVAAESNFMSITGQIINGLEDDISQMSEDELMALYEANKDSISKEDIEKLYEANKDNLPEGVEGIYEQNKDLITDENIGMIAEGFGDEDFSINEESLDFYLGLLSCSLIKPIINSEISNFEIPEKIPFQNEVFNIYFDNNFLISLNLVDGKFGNITCEESEDVTYDIYIKKELILIIIEEKDNINPLDFYHENRKNGNFDIKPIGFKNKIKFGFINFGLKIASWFD